MPAMWSEAIATVPFEHRAWRNASAQERWRLSWSSSSRTLQMAQRMSRKPDVLNWH